MLICIIRDRVVISNFGDYQIILEQIRVMEYPWYTRDVRMWFVCYFNSIYEQRTSS